ncbi:hypothetical protein HispidOSU_003250 [Sigmodon hispidus]
MHYGSGRRLRSSAATASALGSLGLTLPPIGGGHRASSTHAADIRNLLCRSPRCPQTWDSAGVRPTLSFRVSAWTREPDDCCPPPPRSSYF